MCDFNDPNLRPDRPSNGSELQLSWIEPAMIHSFTNSGVNVCFLSNASLLESITGNDRVRINTVSYHNDLSNIHRGFRSSRWSLFVVVLRIISGIAWPIHCVSVMREVVCVEKQVA
jgi:hypothetical protein